MSQDYEPEVEFTLTAHVDGMEIYKTTSPLGEVISMSVGSAQDAVIRHLEDMENRAEAAWEAQREAQV